MNLTKQILRNKVLPAVSIGWLLFVVPDVLQAQEGEQFFMVEGLPNTVILDIAQDRQGYIWLGTEDGLIRYDGYGFFKYSNIPGDTTSLSQNRIEELFVDYTGDLWIGSKSDLDRYNSACECFVRYASGASTTGFRQAGQINSFAEDKDHNLWIGSQQGGLFRYSRGTNQFVRFLDDPTKPEHLLNDEVRELLVDKNNILWLGTGETFDATVSGGGLVRLNLNTGQVKRFTHDPNNANSLLDNRVSALLEDREGKLWIGTCQNGLHYFNPHKEEIIRVVPDLANPDAFHAPQGKMGLWSSCPHVKIIHQHTNGEFWVGTFNGGLNQYDPIAKKIYRYTHVTDNPVSLNSNQVWSFLEDRQGRLWIGSVTGALQKADPSLHKFTVYPYDPKAPAGLSFGYVMGIYEAPKKPGVVWLGTRGGGLNRLDVATGRFTHFRHNPRDKHSISSDLAWITYEDRNGTFWVGTEAGLDTMNRQTGTFTPYKLRKDATYIPVPFPVIRMHEDREGTMWLGTWSGGIIRLSKDKKTFKRYDFSRGGQQAFYNSVFAIHEDSRGTLWVAVFQGGLFQYDPKRDRFIRHLKEYGATSLLEDNPGVFWVGTISNGLLHYNSAKGTIRQYTTAHGLPSDIVLGIQADTSGALWLATGHGIARLEPATGRLSNYGTSDGLSFTSFNHISTFESADGHIFFGGKGGLVSFDPKRVKGNPHPPDVLIRGLHTAGKPFDLRNYRTSLSARMTLTHQQNDLTFDYVGLHFTNPSENTYKYRLLPYETDWIEAGTQRTARYTNLDPGEYTFQVIAGSSDGVWNKEGASLLLYIAPPWYNTWWAYGLLAGLIFSLSYWFYRFQLSRKLAFAESRRLKEIDHLKNSLYTNITHEFRTPLTVILGMADTLHDKAQSQHWREAALPLEMIHRNGENLLHLVNQLLDLARLQSGHLELELRQSDVILFIKYLCESFHSLAQEKQVNLAVYAEINQLPMDYDATKLATVISNLLSNAIKFTPRGGKIIVHLNQLARAGQEHLLIKVKDTGRGIAKADVPRIFDRFYQADSSSSRLHEGTGIGLALTKELVELMRGTIAVKSQEKTGTEFMVEIPVTRNAPKGEALPNARKRHRLDVPGAAAPTGYGRVLDLPMVLIIEDNEDVVNYLILTLANRYHCLHAPNGTLGLEMAFEEIPDIIICDVMMPEMDGFEVCARLKADERSNHIPVIMLTALVEAEDRVTGLSRGADAYLAKPFERAELIVRLEKLMEIRQLLQQKYRSGLVGDTRQDKPGDTVVEKFLAKVDGIILEHLEEEDFSADQLGQAIYLSRSQVHRKIKALTGHSTSIYIRLVRLRKAKELLASEELTIAEVAYRVGFKSPVYFSQIFKKTFGESPTASRK